LIASAFEVGTPGKDECGQEVKYDKKMMDALWFFTSIIIQRATEIKRRRKSRINYLFNEVYREQRVIHLGLAAAIRGPEHEMEGKESTLSPAGDHLHLPPGSGSDSGSSLLALAPALVCPSSRACPFPFGRKN
jgi:hypothetical protein